VPNVRLDGVDIIKSQAHVSNGTAGLNVDDVVEKLNGVDLNNSEEIPVAKINSSTIQDGQVLTYSSGKWVNNDITAAGAAVNNDLGIARTGASSDIAIEYNFGNDPNTTFLLNGSNGELTNLQDGEHMTWDATAGKWVNSPVMASGGGGGGMIGVDVQTSGGDTDYIFNSGTTISGVGGVDTSALADGATVFWSATDQEWKMSSLVIEEI
jgi:hypothetical protein